MKYNLYYVFRIITSITKGRNVCATCRINAHNNKKSSRREKNLSPLPPDFVNKIVCRPFGQTVRNDPITALYLHSLTVAAECGFNLRGKTTYSETAISNFSRLLQESTTYDLFLQRVKARYEDPTYNPGDWKRNGINYPPTWPDLKDLKTGTKFLRACFSIGNTLRDIVRCYEKLICKLYNINGPSLTKEKLTIREENKCTEGKVIQGFLQGKYPENVIVEKTTLYDDYCLGMDLFISILNGNHNENKTFDDETINNICRRIPQLNKKILERILTEHRVTDNVFIGIDVTTSCGLNLSPTDDTSTSLSEKLRLLLTQIADPNSTHNPFIAQFAPFKMDSKYVYLPTEHVVKLILPQPKEMSLNPITLLARLQLEVEHQLRFMNYLIQNRGNNFDGFQNSAQDMGLTDSQCHYLSLLVRVYAFIEETIALNLTMEALNETMTSLQKALPYYGDLYLQEAYFNYAITNPVAQPI